MKKIALLLMLTIVCCSQVSFAHLSTTNAKAPGDTIDAIRVQYASINKNIKRYRKVEKELTGYSTEGGSLTAYFDGKTIRKIVARFYGEMGRADEEYYFSSTGLIFVFRKESTYNRPLSGKVVSTKLNRFYFDNGRMIRWLDEKGRQVPSSSSTYDEEQRGYLKSSGEYVTLASS